MRQNLGDILLDAGKITLEQLEFALRQQTEAIGSKRRLGRILVEHHFIAEEVLARTLANQLGLSYVDLGSTGLDGSLKDLLPRRVAEKYQVIPLERVDGFLHIAMADPTDVVALDDIRIHSGLDVLPFVALPTDLKEAMDRLYSFDSAAMDVLADLGGTIDVQFVESQVDIEDIGVLQRATETAPIVTLCNSVLAMAVRERCTDIHIEPKSSGIHIRFRVDGLLREIMKLPKTVQPLFISRIKIMSGIDIAERRRPQDGNISLQIDNQSVDCRVSTLPTPIGEKIVIRLLKKGETRINLDSLGMHDDQLKVVYRYLDMPQGLVVFTGPTGAGKTTAMYAALTYIRSPEKNIVTLEDPIEYQMQDLTQVQIDEKIGLTFPRGLRTILRQDPDVVMVGEIRDSETAQIVIQAALTGHLVLSSLHTNDAVSALTRLLDIGVEPFLIDSSLTLVVAVRLVRVVCDRCSEPSPPSDRAIELLELTEEDLRVGDFRRGTGCERCTQSGYMGRTGIFEVLPMTPRLRELVHARAPESRLLEVARSEGVQDIRSDGLRKVFAGITTVDEVLRVTRASDF